MVTTPGYGCWCRKAAPKAGSSATTFSAGAARWDSVPATPSTWRWRVKRRRHAASCCWKSAIRSRSETRLGPSTCTSRPSASPSTNAPQLTSRRTAAAGRAPSMRRSGRPRSRSRSADRRKPYGLPIQVLGKCSQRSPIIINLCFSLKLYRTAPSNNNPI